MDTFGGHYFASHKVLVAEEHHYHRSADFSQPGFPHLQNKEYKLDFQDPSDTLYIHLP